jgi:mRNA-degrading endonuclease RelE of RelBE toxin-antitoxin system
MPYTIEFMPDAQEQLSSLTARQQGILLDKIQKQLHRHPAEETRQRKKLRPNPLAPWELRVGEFRVFFDIDEQEQIVFIIAIGRKKHNTLYIGDREFEL